METREARDLTPFDNVQVQIIDRDKHFPNELLIGLNKENPQVHNVYHLDLTTGNLTLVTKNPGNVMNWVTDAHFKVRAALATLSDGTINSTIPKSEEEPENVATFCKDYPRAPFASLYPDYALRAPRCQ